MEAPARLLLLALAVLLVALVQSRPLDVEARRFHRPFPIVEPDPGHTKLRLAREGLDLLSRIQHPISVVSVIGPYRSGKSFLLNQLLSLSCDEGFGVGHMRDTKTRGIWMWGEPMEIEVDGRTTSVVFVDTEGFESIGKSNVYDDRIFALASLISSVLIYNLPETVREADISKLSFAVELGEEFYGRVKGHENVLEPASLLWLIQRDFLEGKSVEQLVRDALQQVVNPTHDRDIEQPHLHRTKLCELGDSDLEPEYIERREELKKLLHSMIRPKLMQGRTLDGKEFASFMEQILQALNEGDFPSAGLVVEVFNRGVIDRCMGAYNDDMSRLSLPVPDKVLQNFHEETAEKVMQQFEKTRFGRRRGEASLQTMMSELNKAYAGLKTENNYLSSRQCDKLYMTSEDQIERLQDLRLPSMAKFSAGMAELNRTFALKCQGPSKLAYQDRLHKMMARAKSHFTESYNQRLFNWLVAFSLIMVVVGRFVVRFFLLEVAAWALFVFLETYTRILWSAELLYYNPVWQAVVTVWEAIVYSPILDVDRWIIPLASLSLLAFVFWRLRRRKRVGPKLRHSH